MRYERTRIIRHIPSACEVTFKAYRKRQSLSNCMTLNLLGLHHAWQALYSTTRSIQWATAKCVEQETKSTPVSTQTQVLLSPPLLLLLHVYLHYHLLLDQIMREKGSTARSKCSSRYPDTSDSAFSPGSQRMRKQDIIPRCDGSKDAIGSKEITNARWESAFEGLSMLWRGEFDALGLEDRGERWMKCF